MIILLLLAFCLMCAILGPWTLVIGLGILVLSWFIHVLNTFPDEWLPDGRGKQEAEELAERKRMMPTLYGP